MSFNFCATTWELRLLERSETEISERSAKLADLLFFWVNKSGPSHPWLFCLSVIDHAGPGLGCVYLGKKETTHRICWPFVRCFANVFFWTIAPWGMFFLLAVFDIWCLCCRCNLLLDTKKDPVSSRIRGMTHPFGSFAFLNTKSHQPSVVKSFGLPLELGTFSNFQRLPVYIPRASSVFSDVLEGTKTAEDQAAQKHPRPPRMC